MEIIVKCKQVPELAENNNVIVERAFPFHDSKGRQFGGYVILWEVDLVALTPEELKERESKFLGYMVTMEPGHYFVMRSHATRGGHSFGAIQGSRWFKSEAERAKAVDKYFRDAEKRCPKIIAHEQAKIARKTVQS